MKKRYWPQALHILLASGIFLAILILVYQMMSRHNHRFDFTREKIHSLSNETKEILKRMRGSPIAVRAFFANEDPSRRDLENLFQEMTTHHPRFRTEFYDPDRSPSEARRSRVDSYQTTILEYQKREERISESSEEAVTNALIRLAHPKEQTLCFTTGHGENSLSEQERTGLAGWKQVLEDHPYRVQEIQILSQGIPPECDAVVMAGPRYELVPRELDLLQAYPAKGKGLLLLIDPMDPGEGKSFDRLVEPFGILLGQDVVVDKVSRIFGGDPLVPLVSQYANHPITERFRVAMFFPIARSIRRFPEAPEGIDVTELALTTPGSWAETQLKKLEAGEAELDPAEDLPGPVSLAAAAEIQEAPRGARVVVVGDSDFLANAHLPLSGNKDFSLSVLQWLVRDDRWISIRPRGSRFEPLFLKAPQSAGVAIFSIGVLPFGTLLAGSLGIWFRHRTSR